MKDQRLSYCGGQGSGFDLKDASGRNLDCCTSFNESNFGGEI